MPTQLPPLNGQNPVLQTPGIASPADYDIPYAQGDVRQDPWDNRNLAGNTVTQYKFVIPNDAYFRSVEEMFQDSGGTPFDAAGPRTYTRSFLVEVKVNNLGPVQVAKCPGIPVPYAPYIPYRVLEYDLNARCVRIEARRRHQDDWKQWVVTCGYSSQLPPGGHPEKLTDVGWPDQLTGWMTQPWLEPPHLEIDPHTYTKYPDLDRKGKAYLNSVQQPFATPIAVPAGEFVLVVTRNYQHPGSLAAVKDYVERYSLAVNSDIFLGAPPGAVQLDPVKLTEMYRGRLRYWRAVYRFKFKKRVTLSSGSQPNVGNLTTWDTWQPRVLDNGMFRYRKVFGAVMKNLPPVPIMRNGHPVSFPVPLDGNGSEAARDSNGKVTAYWHTFEEFEALPFSALVLPSHKL